MRLSFTFHLEYFVLKIKKERCYNQPPFFDGIKIGIRLRKKTGTSVKKYHGYYWLVEFRCTTKLSVWPDISSHKKLKNLHRHILNANQEMFEQHWTI